MATTVVLTEVNKDPNGKVRVRFADGTELEFESLEALSDEINQIDSDVGMVQRMALGWIKARQPTLDNIAPIAGKDFIFDLSSTNPIKVQ